MGHGRGSSRLNMFVRADDCSASDVQLGSRRDHHETRQDHQLVGDGEKVRLRKSYGVLTLCLHRAAAAFFAISERRAGDKAAALAGPPLGPPSLPKATAAGFFPVSASMRSKTFLASSTGSVVLERLGMVTLSQVETWKSRGNRRWVVSNRPTTESAV